ncbi:MAG: metallophosphatase family protein [Fibrobacterales bacterium]
MQFAVVSDIHSNFYALEAVYFDIRSRGIDTIYCAGDIAGYYTLPNETIDLLKKMNAQAILGNHDFDILYRKFKDPMSSSCPKVWNYNNLSESSLEYLKSLPDFLNVEVEGKKIHICHGSPSSRTEYLHQNSLGAELAITSIEHDILICGHTHIPYHQSYGNKHIINSGSVGKPKNGSPNATYVIVTVTDDVSVEIGDVQYKFHKTVEHVVNSSELPEQNTLSLIYGK